MGSRAKKVIEMLEKMKLTESEKKGIKIEGSGAGSNTHGDPQAVRKVLMEKPVRADAIEATLGRVWCPLKGIECKDLGENFFLFTFLQGSGKRKAMEDGPWMFGKDLIILAEYDGAKRVDEIAFTSIPIWVRVSKLPLGLMNRVAGEEIGEMIGEVIKVDADDDDMAFGECLRIKIRLDIRKPLMRGVTLDVSEEGDGEERMLWSPVSYEFLPDFCYTCGLIGHTDRLCEIKLKKGEVQQFSRNLCYIPEKKKSGEDSGSRFGGQHSQLPWKVNRGGRGADNHFGSWGSGSGRGSDATSWRKSESDSKKEPSREESGASSPLKLLNAPSTSGHAKHLVFDVEKAKESKRENSGAVEPEKGVVVTDKSSDSLKKVTGDVNSSMHDNMKDMNSTMQGQVTDEQQLSDEKSGGRRGFKRLPRAVGASEKVQESMVAEGKKRVREDVEEMDIDGVRKEKMGRLGVEQTDVLKAGLVDRSCEQI